MRTKETNAYRILTIAPARVRARTCHPVFPPQPIDLRLDAAKAAIPFEKPRLAALKTDAGHGSLSLEELVLGSYKTEAREVLARH